MKIQGVGHVVLKVRDLDRSRRFYTGVLGLKEVGQFPGRMVFFSATGANHHDLAVLAVGPEAATPAPEAVGLAHVALKIGDSLDDLREARALLEAHAIPIRGIRDHTVSQSLYLEDPDGNAVELFVDADPAIWAADPGTVATTKPLAL
ncbi:MAG: VOC family protein [Candidatus Rokubacteria bacterium]|nr:VOC family protein [Candidatus Rokubacteria bacterium]